MFNKKNLNKFIASCISIATIAIPMSITVNASTYSRLIDNDPTSSSGNSSSNDFTGLWLVSVSPSGQPNCQTGADAVNVTYTY